MAGTGRSIATKIFTMRSDEAFRIQSNNASMLGTQPGRKPVDNRCPRTGLNGVI